MAEVPGVEPGLSESKSDVLPLHNTSMFDRINGRAAYPASQVLLRVCRAPFPTSLIHMKMFYDGIPQVLQTTDRFRVRVMTIPINLTMVGETGFEPATF